MKILRGCGIWISLFLLAACHHTSNPYHTPKSSKKTPEVPIVSATFPAFHGIVIDGPYDVLFKGSNGAYRISATGDKGIIDHSTAHLEGDSLVIRFHSETLSSKKENTWTSSMPVQVVVEAPLPKEITIQRGKRIYLEKITIPHLSLRAQSGEITVLNAFGGEANYNLSGGTRLIGNCMNTKHLTIEASQHANVQLKCLTVDTLNLKASNNAHMEVTGQAHTLQVNLTGNSTLEGEDIRAGHVDLTTSANSQSTWQKQNVGWMNVMGEGHSQTVVNGDVSVLSGILKGYAELLVPQGNIHELKIHLDGLSVLEFSSWKPKHISVRGDGHSYIRLKGRTERLDGELQGSAKLDSICLKTPTVFVKTWNQAEARVRNDHGLSAVAHEESNIYYYQDPKMVAAYLRSSGSVIRMTSLVQVRC